MKTINISITTKDSDYDVALSRSLLLNNNYFTISVHQSKQDNREWDLLLTDDMNTSNERTVYLTDDPTLESISEENNCYILYKYQQVGHISNILRLAHSGFSNSIMPTDDTEQTNIICICSSSGGSGCTSVALAISQELSRFHCKKVLYISLEEFESTDRYFPESKFEFNNINKFLYLILNNSDRSCHISEGYMCEDEYGVFTFHPSRGRNPLRELTGNEFAFFINHITKEKVFTDLILDCGNGLDESILSAFQISNMNFIVTGKNPNFIRRNNYLLTVSNRIPIKDSLGFLNVFNMFINAEEEIADYIRENEMENLIIEEDSTSFEITNGRIVISLDKTFGKGIREVVKHIVISNR
jgi:MinD-like ATPase involved in chromosome partitioning or flagellar assembly